MTSKLLALFAAFALLMAAPALRAEKAAGGDHGPAAKADAHAAGHDEGKDDPTKFIDLPKRWDLSIYTIVVFLLLFFFLKMFAWPNITKGLAAREALIASAKEDAIKAKAEAEEMRKKLAEEFAINNDKIRAMMEEARRDADALRVKEREAGQKDAAAERERAKREIEAAKDAALQEIYQKSVDLATLISTKAIRRQTSADDHRNLVNEALAELGPGRI
ncbi:hypothetical protein BH11PLA2_BH11PLA2_00360 [soil metagenome]